MIKTLAIANFQSHKDTVLEFDPGVNIIVGATDSGKTAIIRALRWLIWNRPGGDAFRSRWGGQTEVWLNDTDAYQVTRYKNDKGQNVYKLNEEYYEAFGTGIPDPIKEFLNIDETNLQQQLDSPFLISSTPGEIASYFNRVAHLDQIDTGIKTIQQSLRKLGIRKEEDQERTQGLQTELEGYTFIDKFEVNLEVLEQIQDERNQKGAKVGKLAIAISDLEKVEDKIADCDYTLSFQEQVDEILGLMSERDKLEEKKKACEDQIRTINHVSVLLGFDQRKINLRPTVSKLLKLIESRDEKQKDVDALLASGTELTETAQKINATRITINHLEGIFATNMPDECPLCGTDLSK